ncbi:hypothetical protein D5085_00990 [Ectothiorhodospiraceae bacterium BW-2]|nr:hypothetical protein D5085_00990 [Ectothiorhodospiraceae bacterium BW-2]
MLIYQCHLTLTLVDDLVLSAHSGSQAEHHCLDTIPGANLLGIAAARLYRDSTINREEQIWLFQSGRCRFGYGHLMLDDHQCAEPTSCSFHYVKRDGNPLDNRTALIGQQLRDCADARFQPEDGVQLKSLPVTLIDPRNGVISEPKQSMDQKTAINPNNDRAADGKLFNYRYLLAGQRFRATLTISCDNENEWQQRQPLLDKLHQALQGTKQFGKSRSSEYGRVEVTVGSWSPLPSSQNSDTVETLSLRLLADMAAFDAYGNPTFTPQPEEIGLPKGDLIPEQSFITQRRYSPYNGYLRSRDTERQVIERGSLLTFRFSEPQSQATLEPLLAQGLGAYRRDGLGEASLTPLPLSQWQGEVTASQAVLTLARPKGDSTANHALIEWLKHQPTAANRYDDSKVRRRLSALRDLYLQIKAFHGQPPESEFGPGRSQWSMVQNRLKEGTDRNGIANMLENELKDEFWTLEALRSDETITFKSWLLDEIRTSELNLTELALLAKGAKEERNRAVAQKEKS